MTKADIINEISLTTGLQKKDVSAVVEAFMETIKTHMVDEKENIYLRGFGSFIVKHRAQKIGRIISKNTSQQFQHTTFQVLNQQNAFQRK